MTQETPERRRDEYDNTPDREHADQVKTRELAICRDCGREWSGGGSDAVARTHAVRYDHRVRYVDERIYDGPEEDTDA